jgi:hypothetical protein
VIHVPDENVMFTGDIVEDHSACYCGDGHFADWGDTLDNIASFDVDAIAPGRGGALIGKEAVHRAIESTRDFVESTYLPAAKVAARGGTLKEAWDAVRASCDPKFKDYAIYEHCLPFNVARAFDDTTEQGRAFARLGVALAKYLSNRLCPAVIAEAMECLGGTGYIEETGLPMLYREAPLNGLWEGSGNVICLDILSTLRAVPVAGEVLGDALGAVTGEYRRYDAALRAHMGRFPRLPDEGQARWYADSLATLLTASVLIRQAPPAIAEAYIATRLTGERGRTPGAISGVDTCAILARLG